MENLTTVVARNSARFPVRFLARRLEDDSLIRWRRRYPRYPESNSDQGRDAVTGRHASKIFSAIKSETGTNFPVVVCKSGARSSHCVRAYVRVHVRIVIAAARSFNGRRMQVGRENVESCSYKRDEKERESERRTTRFMNEIFLRRCIRSCAR